MVHLRIREVNGIWAIEVVAGESGGIKILEVSPMELALEIAKALQSNEIEIVPKVD